MNLKEFEERFNSIPTDIFYIDGIAKSGKREMKQLILDLIGENKATGLICFKKQRFKEIGRNELREELRQIVTGEKK
jgi:hypothetical protein